MYMHHPTSMYYHKHRTRSLQVRADIMVVFKKRTKISVISPKSEILNTYYCMHPLKEPYAGQWPYNYDVENISPREKPTWRNGLDSRTWCDKIRLMVQVRAARNLTNREHYNDVLMSAMASQIISVSIVCSTVGSGADKKKPIKTPRHWTWPVISPHKRQVTQEMFPFDDIIM